MSDFVKFLTTFVLSIVVGILIMATYQQAVKAKIIADHIVDNCLLTESFVIVGGVEYPVYDCSKFGEKVNGTQ